MADLASLTITDAPERWAALGFSVRDAATSIGGVVHRFAAGGGKGITSWQLSGVPQADLSVDGLATEVVPTTKTATAGSPHHPNGVTVIDHVVVVTPDHGRTLAALAGAGLSLLRTRQSDTYGSPMVQGFFRLGSVVLEVVGPAAPVGDGPAAFFGIAFTVADLDATAEFLGARLHPAKAAVQPGRRIATLDRSAGIGTRLAFMSPESTG